MTSFHVSCFMVRIYLFNLSNRYGNYHQGEVMKTRDEKRRARAKQKAKKQNVKRNNSPHTKKNKIASRQAMIAAKKDQKGPWTGKTDDTSN